MEEEESKTITDIFDDQTDISDLFQEQSYKSLCISSKPGIITTKTIDDQALSIWEYNPVTNILVSLPVKTQLLQSDPSLSEEELELRISANQSLSLVDQKTKRILDTPENICEFL